MRLLILVQKQYPATVNEMRLQKPSVMKDEINHVALLTTLVYDYDFVISYVHCLMNSTVWR